MTAMLMIRLQRVGKKNEPTFKLVLTDSKNSTKSGKFLEVLGAYDARDKNVTKIDADRAKYWISKGAQLTDSVHNLFVNKKIIEGKKINVLPRKSPIKKEEAKVNDESKAAPAAPAADAAKPAPAGAEAPKEEPKAEEKPAEPANATESTNSEPVKSETPAEKPAA